MTNLMLKLQVALFSLSLVAMTSPRSQTESAMRSLGVESEVLPEIAVAIDSATTDRFERLMLASVAWHESRYANDVARCERLGDKGKAAGAWQTWAIQCPMTIQEQANEALRHLRSARRYCKGGSQYLQAVGAVSLYATGKTCTWNGAERRWATMRRLGRLM